MERKIHDRNLDWKKIYTNTLIATKEIKLRNFQYKYIMRIIPTNKYLQKYGIGESALCDFYNMEIETTDYLFWQCMRTQQYWTEISTFLIEYDIHLTLNLQTVTFGITFSIEKPDTQLKNFLILLGKYFVL